MERIKRRGDAKVKELLSVIKVRYKIIYLTVHGKMFLRSGKRSYGSFPMKHQNLELYNE